MDKVLVFTNKDSWCGISDGIRDREYGRRLSEQYPTPADPVLEPEFAPGVCLVYDGIELPQLFDGHPSDHFHVLIHTRGRQLDDFKPWENQCEFRVGKHENYVEYWYYPVFDIITDEDGNKLERIIQSVFMTEEAALDFLNDCLIPGLDLDESLAYYTLYQREEYREGLEKFRKKYESSESLDDYMEDLTRLRDTLLAPCLDDH